MDVIPLSILIDGHEEVAEMQLFDESIECSELVRIIFCYKDITLTSDATDYFGALCSIRSALEKLNIQTICAGSEKMVYPSPMMQRMGTGRKAYRLRMYKPTSLDDVVDIFSPGEQLNCVSVEQQYSYYQKWLTSMLDN